jgi:hypothetical protein
MPEPRYLDLEYFYNYIYHLLQKGPLFFLDIDWSNIIFWAKAIAAILAIVFVIGIIYNLSQISRYKK